ncbi:MAG: hypothetical protein LLG44_06145 [Chloroflexi bacterium]|nr:hypothetical protein [Chloroflexota bacterium]
MLRIITTILLVSVLAGCTPVSSAVSTHTPIQNMPTEQAITPQPTAVAAEEGNLYAPQPSDENLVRDPVAISLYEILLLPGNPLQFKLHLVGSTPTTCHVLRVAVPPADADGRIAVEAYALVESDAVPTQAIKPFDVTVSLAGYPAGQYTVWLNGELVGEMVLPEADAEEPASYAPQPGDEDLTRGTVYIDSREIFLLKTNPPQFRLSISGALPTPCHALRVVVPAADAEGRIDIEAYSLVKPGAMCAQVLEPFSTTISLAGYPAGQYSIWLNGDKVGEMVVPASGDISMKGWELYSWQEDGVFSYALLAGTNRLKTLDEIQALDVRLADVEAVKTALARLAEGEVITWSVLDYGGGELPPQAVRDEIAAFAEAHGLILQIAVR